MKKTSITIPSEIARKLEIGQRFPIAVGEKVLVYTITGKQYSPTKEFIYVTMDLEQVMEGS